MLTPEEEKTVAVKVEAMRPMIEELARVSEERDRYKRALQEIANGRPKNYTPNQEHWEWGNYDDSYSYGYDTASNDDADVADKALNPTPETNELRGEKK